MESAFVVAQIAQAIPELEKRGLLGPDELPMMRCLGRAIVHNAQATVDFAQLFRDDVN